MDKQVKEKVVQYTYKNYPNRFEKKELMVEEYESHFRVKSNVDESPLILGKGIV